MSSYLDGTLAGDYGFDPLKLGADGKIEQYRVAEVIHGRWAMLAIPGIVVPEALGIPGGVWTETGKVFLDGETGRPEILGNPYIFTAIEVALMAAVEGYRSGKIEPPAGFAPFYGKFESSDFSGLDPINPGGPLDFFNVASTPEDLAILKVKEIKNARPRDDFDARRLRAGRRHRGGPRHQLGQARRRPLRLQLHHHHRRRAHPRPLSGGHVKDVFMM